MASLRSRVDHQQAASRRLELLTAELAAMRAAPPDPDPVDPPPPDEPWLAGHTRIRPLRTLSAPAPQPVSPTPPAPVVPAPGRHASRRVRPAALVPEALRGRVTLGPSQLLVVAVIVAIGVVAAAWWIVRSEPERLQAPGPAAAATPGPTSSLTGVAPQTPATSPVAAAPSGPAGSPASGATGATVTVDVTGKVRARGIVVLDPGARVVDAIEAAGGAPRVDLSSLNLARVLVDGEQIVVGRPTSPVAPVGGPTPGGGAPAAAVVNLNTATQEELESLPEVGPVTAESILAWRSEHGGSSAVDELLEVDGIGDATLAKIAPHVTV